MIPSKCWWRGLWFVTKDVVLTMKCALSGYGAIKLYGCKPLRMATIEVGETIKCPDCGQEWRREQ